MDNQILRRDIFVENFDKCDDNEVNEGLLDFFKTLAKREWNSVKSKNAIIKTKLEEVDKKLKGFTLAKLKNTSACAEIRQTLCDYGNTLWDYKQKQIEDGKKLKTIQIGLETPEIESKDKKSLDLKDDAVKDKLYQFEKKIGEMCDGDPRLKKWSRLLKGEIRNIVNDMVINEYEKNAGEDEEKKISKYRKNLDTQKKEEQKTLKDEDSVALKSQEDMIKEIEKERTDALSSLGLSPINTSNGEEAVNKLKQEIDNLLANANINIEESHKYSFKNLLNEEKEKNNNQNNIDVKGILEKDPVFGLAQIVKTTDVDDKTLIVILKEIKQMVISFDELVNSKNLKESIKETASDSIHAMFAGLVNTIYCALSETEPNDKIVNLLARCSISSDKTIGFGLPMMGDEEDSGNIFTELMKMFKVPSGKIESILGDKKDEFTKRMGITFDKIMAKGNKIKDEKAKEDEKNNKELENEEK